MSISGWQKIAWQLPLNTATMEAYANAFEHPLFEEARRLLGG